MKPRAFDIRELCDLSDLDRDERSRVLRARTLDGRCKRCGNPDVGRVGNCSQNCRIADIRDL